MKDFELTSFMLTVNLITSLLRIIDGEKSLTEERLVFKAIAAIQGRHNGSLDQCGRREGGER